jgi:hypothetical protein
MPLLSKFNEVQASSACIDSTFPACVAIRDICKVMVPHVLLFDIVFSITAVCGKVNFNGFGESS